MTKKLKFVLHFPKAFTEMDEELYTQERMLLAELQLPGREFLYDFDDPNYKNNHRKQIIWDEIAENLGMERVSCQAVWKNLKSKYKLALCKSEGKTETEIRELKPFFQFLLKEMEFFQNFVEDKKKSSQNGHLEIPRHINGTFPSINAPQRSNSIYFEENNYDAKSVFYFNENNRAEEKHIWERAEAAMKLKILKLDLALKRKELKRLNN